ncbi:MAG: FeoB-associated Cys-rich membrane protein [Firmicutes bacterium]|nr:FeoB-associated Cys-rich membrane protein [Bacillota bacterium]
MAAWITENMASIVIGLLLAAVVSLIVRSLIKNKKTGKSSCGCGCSHCPMSGACEKKDVL